MYMNLVFDNKKTPTISSVNYIIGKKLENIVAVRGFAKEFGLCGFKVGYLITCNKKIKEYHDRLKVLVVPSQYTL